MTALVGMNIMNFLRYWIFVNERKKRTLHFLFDCLNLASHVTFLQIDAVLSGTMRRSLRQRLYEIDSTLQPQL